MTETDDSKPPDTLPPPKDAEPTPRELMAALLATRDIVVDSLEARVGSVSDASDVVDALKSIAEAIRPSSP